MTNLFKGKTYEGTSFIIDKIYPNKKDMDAAAATDEVFVGRYVLVSYTDQHLEQDERDSIVLQLQGHIGLDLALSSDKYKNYVDNIKKDNNVTDGTVPSSITSYDKVVYRKMCIDGQQKYEEVASLNTTANKFIKGISKNDKILTISNDVNKVLEAHLSFDIKTEEKTDTTESGKKLIEKYLVVYGKEYKNSSGQIVKHEIARLDLTEYYKDIFLAGVSWDKGNHALKFLIGDKDNPNVVTETTVSVDLMNAGDGIDIGTDFDIDNKLDDGPVISINLSEPSGYTNYLEVSEDGLSTNQNVDTHFMALDKALNALRDTQIVKTQPQIKLNYKYVIKDGNSSFETNSYTTPIEIGSNVVAKAKIDFTDGEYKYKVNNPTNTTEITNKKAGISLTSWRMEFNNQKYYYREGKCVEDISITNKPEVRPDTNGFYSFTEITNLADNYTKHIMYTASHSQGTNIPYNNIGEQCSPISAEIDKNLGATVSNLQIYREGCYYDTTADANFNIDSIDSDFIRGLTGKTKKNYSAGTVTSSFTIPKDTTAIIIACPKEKNQDEDYVGPSEVLNTTNNSKMTELMGSDNHKKIVSVYSANEYDQKDYKVWVFKPDTGAYETKQTLKITLG